MTAASPGIIATTLLNAYHDSHEGHVRALAREMKKEYELIYAKGLILQIDAPDLAMERSFLFQKEPLGRFRKIVETHVEAINLAVENIPAERVRLHVCWGNYDGPHTHDVPLEGILPVLYRARVGALSLELANPCHQHRVPGLQEIPSAGLHDPSSRGHRLHYPLCGASGGSGGAHFAGGRGCGGSKPGGCFYRLWFWHLCRVGDGGRKCGVGQASGAKGRGRPCQQAALGVRGQKIPSTPGGSMLGMAFRAKTLA